MLIHSKTDCAWYDSDSAYNCVSTEGLKNDNFWKFKYFDMIEIITDIKS